MTAIVEFWNNLHPLLQGVIKGLAVIGVMFPIGGACSLVERKVSAAIQGRPGPNRAMPFWFAWVPVIGPFLQRLGVFHLMADGAKMFFKEDSLPGHVNKFYFLLAPVVAMIPALTTVTVVPFGAYFDEAGRMIPLVLANLDVGILAVFAIGSLGVYSLILAGWASNSKYPFLGGIRASAQLISYELSMTLAVVPVFLMINVPGGSGTLSLTDVVGFQSGTWQGLTMASLHGTWFIMTMPLAAIIFLVALFAETNRLPFDMAEGEADLVGGFHTEYGAMKWGLFFVAEYSHMLIGSGVFTLLFLGGWNPLPFVPLASVVGWLAHLSPLFQHPLAVGLLSIGIFLAKVLFFMFLFMWVRWTVPRFRYDQVMKLGWQKLLPLAIGNLIFYAVLIALLQPKL
ncbi:NADH-quinone oxidoreductase subunit 8 [Lacunisphaera limnophila]|uniref:NADH-quinone oxidoreductase subunit H n=1 Tax=Lacunisphaera limnophila TaxID=1838286 RepID=A0A1D8AUS8_9BACT|nr:complex I subunit 1 family protein [Lacunisphaera limnophila]AOS44644.1 NADH-quinone oxidoreductase subunit 8 [Lacunisphaera limnophila]